MKKQLFAAVFAFIAALLITSTGCDSSEKKDNSGMFAGLLSGPATDSSTDPVVDPPVNPPVNPPVDPPVDPPVNPPVDPPVIPPVTETLRLVFTGDIAIGTSTQTAYQYVAEYLNGADFVFADLACVMTAAAPIAGLSYAGIDAVSVANDHTFAGGRPAFDRCLAMLKAAGIAPIGGGSFTEAYTAKIFDVKGTRVAFLAFTLVGEETIIRAQSADNGMVPQTGVAWFYTKYVNPAIIAAKKTADIVIVSMHFGADKETLPNSEQDRFAHQCIDQGAHLVIGHHPGVIQPVMVYAKGFLAYSLGNLVSNTSVTAAKRGMMLEVLLQNKKIYQVNRKYVQINSSYQPVMQ